MIWELALAALGEPAHPLSVQLLENAPTAPRVQQVVQLSLAPAFLLGAIGAIMNVMMARLIWIAGRIERLGESVEADGSASHAREIAWLTRRRQRVRTAIMLSSASAMSIAIVIALLFITAYIELNNGTIIAGLWIVSMALLIWGLGCFVMESLLSAKGFDKTEA